ncbi:hypothetical protein PybrP1_009412 [[Pythium] brassicae (nom. inval.)]|nr:hypothetical protein PybrP1_009412 [[Pythium] brassicae (nom. inval.)]
MAASARSSAAGVALLRASACAAVSATYASANCAARSASSSSWSWKCRQRVAPARPGEEPTAAVGGDVASAVRARTRQKEPRLLAATFFLRLLLLLLAPLALHERHYLLLDVGLASRLLPRLGRRDAKEPARRAWVRVHWLRALRVAQAPPARVRHRAVELRELEDAAGVEAPEAVRAHKVLDAHAPRRFLLRVHASQHAAHRIVHRTRDPEHVRARQVVSGHVTPLTHSASFAEHRVARAVGVEVEAEHAQRRRLRNESARTRPHTRRLQRREHALRVAAERAGALRGLGHFESPVRKSASPLLALV